MKTYRMIIGLIFTAITVLGQGTINFANFVVAPGGMLPDGPFNVNEPVFNIGGVGKLEGPQYFAQLYVASAGVVGDPVPFRTGAFAGYWDPVLRVVPNALPGSTVTVAVYAWDTLAGSTYEAARVLNRAAASTFFTLVLGGDGKPPADLLGLRSFTVPLIPEPCTGLLGFVGAMSWFFKRLICRQRKS